LEESFADDYRNRKIKFEFDIDNHWSSVGHEVVAREVIKELKRMKIK
jgi:hypothetical protein